jgi:hypothetical protein
MMKKLNYLKMIVDIIWALAILATGAFVVSIILFYTSESLKNDAFTFNKINFNSLSIIGQTVLIFYLFIRQAILLYGLYLFKKVLHLFVSLQFFTTFVVISFNKIGSILLFISVLNFIIYSLFQITYEHVISSKPLYDNMLILGVGFFFIVLSEIFKTSQLMKQENELTI